MNKTIYFDFVLETCVSVEGEMGTDPDSLLDAVGKKLISSINDGDVIFRCENIFDPATGEYGEDPIDWYEDY